MLSWCSSSLFWNICHHCMPRLCLSELNWLLLMFCSNSVLLWVARAAGFRHQVQFDKEEKAQREEETQGKEGGRGSRGEWKLWVMWEVCGRYVGGMWGSIILKAKKDWWTTWTSSALSLEKYNIQIGRSFQNCPALHIVNLCGAMARQTRHPAPWHAAL